MGLAAAATAAMTVAINECVTQRGASIPASGAVALSPGFMGRVGPYLSRASPSADEGTRIEKPALASDAPYIDPRGAETPSTGLQRGEVAVVNGWLAPPLPRSPRRQRPPDLRRRTR